jgi:hypothetical protein
MYQVYLKLRKVSNNCDYAGLCDANGNSLPSSDDDDDGGGDGGNSGNSTNPVIDCFSNPVSCYQQGWNNFNSAVTAWNNNPNDPLIRAYAGIYIVGWGGAHVAGAVGLAGLACVAAGPGCVAVVEGALGIGTAADTACGGDMCASEAEQGITVLGYSEDVRFYTGVRTNILVDQPNWSWKGMNVPFLDKAMARGDLFVYVSNSEEFVDRVFNREVAYLAQNGYTNIIDLFH